MQKLKQIFSTNKGTLQNLNHLRKFYKEATVERFNNSTHKNHKFIVKLDGKQIRTPNRNILAFPSQELAFLVAHQFNSQIQYLKPALMPLLSFSRTAVDIDYSQNIRQDLTDTIYQFLQTDTLLFCAQQYDSYVKKYQQTSLKAAKQFSELFSIQLKPSYSLQPPEIKISHQFVDYIDKLDNWKILSLQTITSTLKSTIASTLVLKQKIGADEAIKMARMEQIFQVERFGVVEQKLMEENYIEFYVNSAFLFQSLSCR